MLIAAVCAEGASLDQLMKPWDGFPETSLYGTFRVRCMVAWPVAFILWDLCLMHALHKVRSG